MTNFRKTIIAAAVLAAAQTSITSSAHAIDLNFDGTVLTSCVLVVGNNGVMAASADNKTLSTKLTGGVQGRVVAAVTGGDFEVFASTPTSFSTSPGAGGGNVEFTTEYSLTGSTTSSAKPGSSRTAFSPGVTTVNVDLEAVKTSGIYEAGLYRAALTVTCE